MSTQPIPVVRPPREIAGDTISALEIELTTLVSAEGPGLVLDLIDVDFMGSAGLGLLVKVGMRLDGQERRMALARADREVEKTIRLLGLHTKLPLYRSVEEAQLFVAGQPTAD